MNGSLLKTRLSTIEPNLAEAAKKLNMSRQAFYQALEAADIKSGLIERLAVLYNRPIGFFFDDKVEDVANTQYGNGVQQYAGRDATYSFDMKEHDELIRLREEVKFLREMMKDRDERIAELKERIEELKGQK